MFLNYAALAILFLGLLMAFYVFIFLHNLPYAIAKKRSHPQTEAIHVACWLSLFTLHAIWPIVFIWAIANEQPKTLTAGAEGATNDADVHDRLKKLEDKICQVEAVLNQSAKEDH